MDPFPRGSHFESCETHLPHPMAGTRVRPPAAPGPSHPSCLKVSLLPALTDAPPATLPWSHQLQADPWDQSSALEAPKPWPCQLLPCPKLPALLEACPWSGAPFSPSLQRVSPDSGEPRASWAGPQSV